MCKGRCQWLSLWQHAAPSCNSLATLCIVLYLHCGNGERSPSIVWKIHSRFKTNVWIQYSKKCAILEICFQILGSRCIAMTFLLWLWVWPVNIAWFLLHTTFLTTDIPDICQQNSRAFRTVCVQAKFCSSVEETLLHLLTCYIDSFY